jgi:hypothetical protein
LNFGTVKKGTQVNKAVTLTNAGSTAVSVTGFALSGADSPDFTYSSSCGSSIAAGQNCTITMFVTPSIVGAEKATFKVCDNRPGSPQSLSLSGTGQ